MSTNNMAYDNTKVPIANSQGEIRRLVELHKGTGIGFMSQPPREGFDALVTLKDVPYHIRVTAQCQDQKSADGRAQEVRRVWRVLYWHIKAMFEAVDSGVIAVEDVILPYIVMPDGHTIAEHIAPKLLEVRQMAPMRMLQLAGFKSKTEQEYVEES